MKQQAIKNDLIRPEEIRKVFILSYLSGFMGGCTVLFLIVTWPIL